GTIRPDGKAEGRILRIVHRANATVVGIFHYGSRQNYVVPIDQKIAQEVVIPAGMETPPQPKSSGEGSSQERREVDRVVGDEARRTRGKARENVVVHGEIPAGPTQTKNAGGRVIEVLGYQDDFGVDAKIIIRKFHLPHRFPAEVLQEAQQAEASISSAEMAR